MHVLACSASIGLVGDERWRTFVGHGVLQAVEDQGGGILPRGPRWGVRRYPGQQGGEIDRGEAPGEHLPSALAFLKPLALGPKVTLKWILQHGNILTFQSTSAEHQAQSLT